MEKCDSCPYVYIALLVCALLHFCPGHAQLEMEDDDTIEVFQQQTGGGL